MTPTELPLGMVNGMEFMVSRWTKHVENTNAFTMTRFPDDYEHRLLPACRLFHPSQHEALGFEAIAEGIRYCLEQSFYVNEQKIQFQYAQVKDDGASWSLTTDQASVEPYAAAIVDPPCGAPSYASDNAKDLLCFVFRQIATYLIESGRNVIHGQETLDHLSNMACDLTYSYLCYLFFNDPYSDKNLIPEFLMELKSRAQFVDGCCLLIASKFDHNGIYVGLNNEKEYLKRHVEKMSENMFSLDNVISGQYQIQPLTEVKMDNYDPVGNDILPSDFEQSIQQDPSLTIDDDYIRRTEERSDDAISSAREAYYAAKDKELSRQSDMKTKVAEFAKSLKFSTMPDATLTEKDIIPSKPEQPHQNDDVADPIPHFDQSEDDDMNNYPMPNVVFSNGQTSQGSFPESPQHPNHPNNMPNNMQGNPMYQQQPPQQNDPYVLTGAIMIGNQQHNIPAGKKLLVDAGCTPLTKNNGELIYVAVNAVDCRSVHRVSGPNNEAFCPEGFPFIFLRQHQNDPGKPLALSHTQQQILSGGQPQQSMGVQQPMQQQTNTVQPAKPWARANATNNQAEQVFNNNQNQTASSTHNPHEESTLSSVFRKAEAKHHQTDPNSVNVQPVDIPKTTQSEPQTTAEDLVFDNDVSVEIADGVVIPMHPVEEARYLAVGMRSFKDRLNYDSRKFMVLVGMFDGYALEVIVNKDSFMKRELHDPYHIKPIPYKLTPEKGEMCADEINDQANKQPEPTATVVTATDISIDEDGHANTAVVGLAAAKERNEPIIANISERVAIPSAPINRDEVDGIFKETKENFGELGYRLMAIPFLIEHFERVAPAIAELLEKRTSKWWEVTIQKRLSVVEPDVSIVSMNQVTVEAMVGHLKECEVFEEALLLFNNEFDKLFNIEHIYFGSGDYNGVIDNGVVDESHEVDELDDDDDNANTETVDSFFEKCRERVLFVKTDMPGLFLPHTRRTIDMGLITPENNYMLFSLLMGAFEKVSDDTKLLRVATAGGSYVTVAKTDNLGTEFVVIDKHL